MKNLIMLDIDCQSKIDVIKIMSQELYQRGKIRDLNIFIEAVIEREKEITTGFGNGIAIPHGKSDSVIETCFVLGKLKNKVDWEAVDNNFVDLVFLLAIPSKDGNESHLRLLSKIAVSIMEEDFVNRLRLADSVEEIDEILNEI